MKCNICQSPTSSFGHAEILEKHPVSFYRCDYCGFIQTETPYWLEESYSSIITKSDIGLISRNLQMATITRTLLLMCFDPTQKFVDYGGGYGMFVRLMRDQGFDFYRHDPLCENLFASGFDAASDTEYALLTAWEVAEHLVDPLAEFEKMFAYSRNILFSTLLLPPTPKPLGEWWYYGLEHGQHVSFYSRETLQIILKKFNLRLHYSDNFIHFIGKKNMHPAIIKITFDERFRWLRRLLSKPQPGSLLEQDFFRVTGIPLR
jgi:hypothetical protein